MKNIETGDSPSYEEVMERFGEKVSLDQALEKTSYLQQRYPEITAIGSVLSSEEVYGHRDIRETSQGLDFVADPQTIEEAIEEHDETWEYSGSYVFTTEDEEDWMVALIPCSEPLFEDEDLESFCVDPYTVMEPESVPTKYGEINTVSPELGLASKLRRYAMQKKNRESFKRSDMVDVGNILARDREENIIDYNNFEIVLSEKVGGLPKENEVLNDLADSLVQGSEAEKDEIEAGLRQTRKILSGSS